jgi:hypothetical protein
LSCPLLYFADFKYPVQSAPKYFNVYRVKISYLQISGRRA